MRTNVVKMPVKTHEGGTAQQVSAIEELSRTVLTCLLWENTFYESGSTIAARITDLVPKCKPQAVADLAIKARNEMKLRHAPLFLIRELARVKGAGMFVEQALYAVIQRADELGEFLALYWKDKKQPISAACKRALAAAFHKFNEYDFAKYNSDAKVKLRDVMFMVHPKPASIEQKELLDKITNNSLTTPDTWEVQLSAGKDKKETFTRLIREKKLGGLATLRNLRKMLEVGVDTSVIKERLEGGGFDKVLPFRFISAARYAPSLEPYIEKTMFKSIQGLAAIPGYTTLLVDVSGSMDHLVSSKSEITRLDAACALAILLRAKGEDVRVFTFSDDLKEVPARQGFALRDAIVKSQHHSGTALQKSLTQLSGKNLPINSRLIVITDEQSNDAVKSAHFKTSWIVNVASYQYGVGYGNGWKHINGWSERILDYIMIDEGIELGAEVED